MLTGTLLDEPREARSPRGDAVPPKTEYGRREVRLPDSLVYRLPAHVAAQEDQDSTALVFTNRDGNVLEYGNLLRRHLKPIVEEVNAPWAGFHTFRHTFASLHLSRGTNLLQLSRAPRPSLGRVHALPLQASTTWRRGTGARPLIAADEPDDLRSDRVGRGMSAAGYRLQAIGSRARPRDEGPAPSRIAGILTQGWLRRV